MSLIDDVVSYGKENPLLIAGAVGVGALFVLFSKRNTGPTISDTEPQSVTYQILGSSGGGYAGTPGGSGANIEPIIHPPIPDPLPNPPQGFRPPPQPLCPPGSVYNPSQNRCVPIAPTHDFVSDKTSLLETMEMVN